MWLASHTLGTEDIVYQKLWCCQQVIHIKDSCTGYATTFSRWNIGIFQFEMPPFLALLEQYLTFNGTGNYNLQNISKQQINLENKLQDSKLHVSLEIKHLPLSSLLGNYNNEKDLLNVGLYMWKLIIIGFAVVSRGMVKGVWLGRDTSKFSTQISKTAKSHA